LKLSEAEVRHLLMFNTVSRDAGHSAESLQHTITTFPVGNWTLLDKVVFTTEKHSDHFNSSFGVMNVQHGGERTTDILYSFSRNSRIIL